MNLAEFDAVEKCIAENRADSMRLLDLARRTEAMLLQTTGIYYMNRGSGFNCYSHEEVVGWYDTPREVFIALLKQRALPEPLEFSI